MKKTFESFLNEITPKKKKDFINYVCDFYCGNEGIWSKYFNGKLTPKLVAAMFDDWYNEYIKTHKFLGDSSDREYFRDYMIEFFESIVVK